MLLLINTAIANCPPKLTMSLTVITNMKETKEKNCIKMNIGVGSVMKSKVRDMEYNTREERTRRLRKEVVGCVQSVAGKNNFAVLFEYVQKKDMNYSSLSVYLRKRRLTKR